MSTFVLSGNPAKGGIPRKSRVRLVALPKRSLVFSGVVSKSLSIDLDPGRYAYTVMKHLGNRKVIRYTEEFMHEVTAEAWSKLKDMHPSMCKVMNTGGGPRYRCTFGGCQEDEFTTALSALLHEVSHSGISPEAFLANPELSVLYNAQAKLAEYQATVKKQAEAEGKVAIDLFPETRT